MPVAVATQQATQIRRVVGLDLGKLEDPSALALLEWEAPKRPTHAPLPGARVPRREYNVPTLKRWPLQTPYRQILADVVRFLQTPPLRGAPTVTVFDVTGVGEAVYEMARQHFGAAGLAGGMCGVSITCGSAVTWVRDGRFNVAKKQLVSVLQVLLGNQRLHIAPQLAEAAVLARELGTFSVKISDATNESFDAWRERDHDDLVLAVALAAWAAESIDLSPPEPPGPTRLRAV
jgi:hypothetical protein